MNIQGKTALVTGASRGIGRAIALELARQGSKCILLVARDQQRLLEVTAEIELLGAIAIPLVLDLTETVSVNVAIAQAWRDYGPIDLLVNCAGLSHQAPFLQTRLSLVQAEIAVNLLGTYTVTRQIGRRMAARRVGTIVNVSSLMGKLAAPTMATYSATKFALLGFTQALRSELADYNIRVIALLPSLTDTDMVRDLRWFRWVLPLSPAQVARKFSQGLQRESPEIVVGWQAHFALLGYRLFPRLMEKFLQLAAPLVEEPLQGRRGQNYRTPLQPQKAGVPF